MYVSIVNDKQPLLDKEKDQQRIQICFELRSQPLVFTISGWLVLCKFGLGGSFVYHVDLVYVTNAFDIHYLLLHS